MTPLVGCYAKIERANENIENLSVEISRLLLNHLEPFVREFKPELGQHIFSPRDGVDGARAMLRFGVLVGEIIHHLRSSLDHLVWQLELANPNRPPTRPNSQTEFPIFLKREEYDTKSTRKIQGVATAAAAAIRDAQPYNGLRENDPLWIVHELDRTDKHRVLLVVEAAAEIEFISEGPNPLDLSEKAFGRWLVYMPLEQAANIATEIHGKTDVNPQPKLQVVFPDFGLDKFQPVIPSLTKLSKATSHLIPGFQRFL